VNWKELVMGGVNGTAPVVLAVSGMTCGGCVNSVKRVLAAVPGVRSVAVDLAAGRAEISGEVKPEALIAAVEAAGYGAAAWPRGAA
jgi:copper chaperone CopZ